MTRRVCSKENPYSEKRDKEESGWGWSHVEAHEVHDSQEDGWPGGDIVTMRCSVCGIEWERELPQ